MSERTPPRFAIWLLERCLSARRRDAVIGDLEERYRGGKGSSWYWRQAVTIIAVDASSPVRWLAALPLALLASTLVLRAGGVAARHAGFQYVSMVAGVTLAVMAFAFVCVGVWIAPARKASVGRMGLAVVACCGAGFLVLAALGDRRDALTPLIFGGCTMLGGVLAFLASRERVVAE
jgi:hypothetical protein